MNNIKSIKIWVIILCMGLIQNTAYSCMCIQPKEEFCYSVKDTDHIILAEVISFSNNQNYMEVKLIDNIQRSITVPKINILGQDGVNCGEHLNIFSAGDTLVLALDKFYDYPSSTWIWYLNGCGFHYLLYGQGNVVGQINVNTYLLPYQYFKDNLSNCVESTVANENIKQEVSLHVFPNPAIEQLSIQSNQLIESYEVYNTQGMLLRNEIVNSNDVKVNLKALNDDMLFFRIRTDKGILTRKILRYKL